MAESKLIYIYEVKVTVKRTFLSAKLNSWIVFAIFAFSSVLSCVLYVAAGTLKNTYAAFDSDCV